MGQYSVTLFTGDASRGCSYCQPGKFQSNDKYFGSKCLDCKEGKYQNAPGKGSCKSSSACGIGLYMIRQQTDRTHDNTCAFCEPGKFSATSSNDECEDCEGGKFNSKPGQKRCNRCAPGRNSMAGQSGCSACAAGRHDVGGNECANCAGGRFSLHGASSCSTCEDGRISAEGAHTCFDCPEGHHSNAPNTICKQNQCTCSNGVGTTGQACEEHGSTNCASCTSSHLLYNGLCTGCKEHYTPVGGSCAKMSTNCCHWSDRRCCGIIKNQEGTTARQCPLRDGVWRQNWCHPEGTTWLDTGTCAQGYKC